MFLPGNVMIRIKSGESIFDVSTANKKDSKYVKGFKIDIRSVVDIDGEEIDLAAAEVAKDDSKNKTILDQEKLTREGRDIVDNLVDIHMGTMETFGINQLPCTIMEYVNWTRPTYYSPPDKTPSTTPSFVFSCPPPSILNKLKEAYDDRGNKYEEDDHGFDEFGWKLLNNGKYYNRYLEEVVDSHPLMKKKNSADNV